MLAGSAGCRLEVVGCREAAKALALLLFTSLITIFYFLIPVAADAATIGRPQNHFGLVGYWGFDVGKGGATVYDQSGYDNHGTLTNATNTTNWVDGVIGRGIEFDEVDDYIITSQTVSIGGDVTLSAWVQYEDASGSAVVASISQGGVGGARTLRIGCSSHRLCLMTDHSGDWPNRSLMSGADGTLTPGETYHLVGTVSDYNQLKLYLNGTLISESTLVDGKEPVDTTAVVRIGGDGANAYSYLGGYIDDVRIYNRAFSAGEVARLYKLGTEGGQKIAQTKTVVPDGLVGHWTFDGPHVDGTDIFDISGSGYAAVRSGSGEIVSGVSGQAMRLEGGGTGRVTVVDPADGGLDFGAGDFTVMAWIKPESITDARNFIHKGAGAGLSGFRFGWTTGGALHYLLGDTETHSSASVSDAGAIQSNEWVHAVIVYDRDLAAHGYINGSFSGESAAIVDEDGLIDNTSNLIVRSDVYGPTNVVLDDVRVYNRVLTVQEIRRIYNATVGEVTNSSFTHRITEGLVGHWTFDGDVTNTTNTFDLSGNRNHGTLTNSPQPTIGRLGQALEFEGSSAYISMGNSDTGLNVSTNDFTLSAWIRTSDPGGAIVSRFTYTGLGSTNHQGYQLLLSGDSGIHSSGPRPAIRLWGLTASQDLVFEDHNFVDGEWHLLTLVTDRVGDKFILYKDGEEVQSESITHSESITATTTEFFVARKVVGSSFYFGGLIDDVRIYDRALSADEVHALYNMGR